MIYDAVRRGRLTRCRRSRFGSRRGPCIGAGCRPAVRGRFSRVFSWAGPWRRENLAGLGLAGVRVFGGFGLAPGLEGRARPRSGLKPAPTGGGFGAIREGSDSREGPGLRRIRLLRWSYCGCAPSTDGTSDREVACRRLPRKKKQWVVGSNRTGDRQAALRYSDSPSGCLAFRFLYSSTASLAALMATSSWK